MNKYITLVIAAGAALSAFDLGYNAYLKFNDLATNITTLGYVTASAWALCVVIDSLKQVFGKED
jgi:hypothetical protein